MCREETVAVGTVAACLESPLTYSEGKPAHSRDSLDSVQAHRVTALCHDIPTASRSRMTQVGLTEGWFALHRCQFLFTWKIECIARNTVLSLCH